MIPGLALLLAACSCQPSDSGAAFDSARETSEPTLDSGESGQPTEGFGVLSLNLHCLKLDGTGFASNRERLGAVAHAVAEEGVRVIALQELCVSSDESAPALLEAALEDATGEPWSLVTAFAHTAWEGTADEAEEHVGLAVQGELGEPRELRFHAQEGLTRVGILGRWSGGGEPLAVASVHLDHQHADARDAQARQAAVEGLVSSAGVRSVVAGDFNAAPTSDAAEAMVAMGYRDLGAGLDDDRIDYIWMHRGADLGSEGCDRIFTGARYPAVSDHPGMLAWLAPAEGEPVGLTTVRTEHAMEGSYLALRGDASPLDWEQGWPASRDGDRWTVVLSEIDEPFEYKWLLGDEQWQQGSNLQGQPGSVNEGSASF